MLGNLYIGSETRGEVYLVGLNGGDFLITLDVVTDL